MIKNRLESLLQDFICFVALQIEINTYSQPSKVQNQVNSFFGNFVTPILG